jgi:ADP-heptose:LPS heptosyltransferase
MNKILIISTNAIGDTYLSFSAIAQIKNHFINCIIDFVVDESSYKLFNSLSGVNHFYVIKKNIKSIAQIISEIRSDRYNLTLNFFPGRINSIVNYFSGGKEKAGYLNFKKNLQWHTKSDRVTINGRKTEKYLWHPTDNYLDRIEYVLCSIGISIKVVEKIKPIKQSLSPKKASNKIVIHPFSKHPEKSLSNKMINHLFNYFLDKNYNIEVICSSSDYNNNFLNLLSHPNLLVSADKPLEYIVEQICSAKMFIAVDSFPLHIADAYNTTYLGIFGPTNCNSVLTNPEKGIQFNKSSIQDLDFETLFPHIENRLNSAERINE